MAYLPRRPGQERRLIDVEPEPARPSRPEELAHPNADPRQEPDIVLVDRGRQQPMAKIVANPAHRFGREMWRRHERVCPFSSDREREARRQAAEQRAQREAARS